MTDAELAIPLDGFVMAMNDMAMVKYIGSMSSFE